MEKMLSERGKILVIFENFKFRNCGSTEKGVKWRCTNKKCPFKLYTDEAMTLILGTYLKLNFNYFIIFIIISFV
jgi:hypothetical protein